MDERNQFVFFLYDNRQPNIIPGFRPKSIASQDSGFLSHDYNIPNIGRLVIYNGVNKINKDSTVSH